MNLSFTHSSLILITIFILIGSVFFLTRAKAAPKAEILPIGAKIPSIETTTEEGKTIDLARESEKGWVLVFFFPKAFTPGCTTQACNLRDHFQTLASENVRVIGISTDSTETLQKFHEKQKLPYLLISDSDKKLAQAFGISTLFGMTKRTTFLFHNGTLIWRDPNPTPSKQTEDALAAIMAQKSRKDHVLEAK